MASNSPNLALRFSDLDKAALVELASRLHMNQTQTVRVLVRETLAILKERESLVPITDQSSRNRTASNANTPTS